MVLPLAGIDLLTWAAQLQIDFPSDNVPALYDPDLWRPWGDVVMQSQSFSASGCPSPFTFSDWRLWAQALAGSLTT